MWPLFPQSYCWADPWMARGSVYTDNLNSTAQKILDDRKISLWGNRFCYLGFFVYTGKMQGRKKFVGVSTFLSQFERNWRVTYNLFRITDFYVWDREERSVMIFPIVSLPSLVVEHITTLDNAGWVRTSEEPGASFYQQSRLLNSRCSQ